MSDYEAPFDELEEPGIEELQARMSSGQVTARQIVERYLARIEAVDRNGPAIRSIIETNPDALEIADRLDRERAASGPRGPLHGIPILLKDNIDTADQMQTTAGSLALAGVRRSRDAFVAAKLRAAGAVLLGKANMSEWANFRSTHSSSGWSARGGQALNPYALDRTPAGSSSGSASAVAASLAAASVGTETDGSILSPASANSVVGIKPTVGLTSRAGVIPVAHSQDTVGPFGRTVADATLLLGVLAGADPRDPATQAAGTMGQADYTRFLDPDGLRGVRLGVARELYFGYSEKADAVVETALEAMRALGAELVDPANIPTARQIKASESEREVLLYEFKADLNAYLAGLGPDAPVRTLEELIAFNEDHAEQEMPYFGQEIFIMAQAKGSLTDQAYLDMLEQNRQLARTLGIDAVMQKFQLDALVMPTISPPWKIDLIDGDYKMGGSAQPAALAGYPAITVPAGYAFGLPVGVTFMGRAFSEPKLIQLAYAFEHATRLRRAPRFVPTTP